MDWIATELIAWVQPDSTRGYRRRSAETNIILQSGRRSPSAFTGDEAQLYLRHGAAHFGIGADRYESGRRSNSCWRWMSFCWTMAFSTGVSIAIDIVLIDALDPFGGGFVFPRGRLREPLSALSRASAFVITRSEPGFCTQPIERVLRKWNSTAPVFRCRVVPRRWLDVRTGQTFAIAPTEAVIAFCGLANPRTFWRTLDTLGVDVHFRWAFGDHHRYRIQELRRLMRRAKAEGAEAVVTTEKDVANLSVNALKLLAPLPVYALEIGIEVDDPAGLMELLNTVL